MNINRIDWLQWNLVIMLTYGWFLFSYLYFSNLSKFYVSNMPITLHSENINVLSMFITWIDHAHVSSEFKKYIKVWNGMSISYLSFSFSGSQIMFPDILPRIQEWIYIHLFFTFPFYIHNIALCKLLYTLLIYITCQFISELSVLLARTFSWLPSIPLHGCALIFP